MSVYNFRQSVEDMATVPLFYENRTPELQITNRELNEEIYQTIEDAGLDVDLEAIPDSSTKLFIPAVNQLLRTDEVTDSFLGQAATVTFSGACKILKPAGLPVGWGLPSVTQMAVTKTLRAAAGWLELGLADEALYELQALPAEVQRLRAPLELRLTAQMEREQWNAASETARLLCLKAEDEPEFFLRAAYCLHETGDTLAACNQLLRGPKTLFEMAVFHYNLACYLWTLGEGPRARSHLKQAIAMDESFIQAAREDRDLVGIGPVG